MRFAKGNDWGTIYYAEKGKEHDERGYADSKRHLAYLKSGVEMTLLWPDGTTEQAVLLQRPVTSDVSDHGNSYTVETRELGFDLARNGVPIWIPLEDVEVIAAPVGCDVPFNRLSPAQAERLHFLVEECGEVIQAACKVLRHGYASVNPHEEGGLTNEASLTREIGHVFCAVEMLIGRSDISEDDVKASRKAKAKDVKKYLHHQD